TAQTAQEEESREVRDALEAASARLEEEERQLTVLEGEYKSLEAQRHDLLRRQSSLQSRALEHRHQLTDRRSRLEQVMARSERLDKRAAELEQSLESAMTRRRDRQVAVEKARSVVEDIEATLKEAEKEVTRLEAEREAVRDEEDVLRRDLATARSSHEQLTARLEALERLHAEGAGLYEGVHAVLQAAEEGQLQGIPGTFASLIRVPPRLDRAFEAALGSRLQNVVAESWEDARTAIEWLKRQRAGRATFLPLDNLRPSRPLQVPVQEGVIGLAAELVSYEDPALEPAVYLLLGRVAVTDDLDAARLLHRQMRGGFQIVTLEGEILRSGGSLTGGQKGSKGRGSNLLARERERAALPARVEAQAAEVAALRDRLRNHG
ncbi:MAG: chromosome segregation protein SMC, partial [Anaerolineae bacterium]